MGSGHFLKGALDFLSEQYIESHFIHNLKLKSDRVEVTQMVLDSCIYGVDINLSAVKLAKMSMWLCTADSNSRLENLDKKFRHGNSLIDEDFCWEREFKDIFSSKGFDVIVGNPPYVYTRSIGEQKEKLENTNYICAEYQPDLYIYFLERVFSLVVPDGVVSLIVPNSFLHYKTMGNLRDFLIKKNSLSEITKAYDAFDGVTVDPVIIVAKKSKNNFKEFQVNDYSKGELPRNIKKIKISELSDDLFVNLSEDKFDVSSLTQVTSSLGKIGDRYKVTMGIKMRGDFIYKDKKNKNSKALLKGRNVFPYSVLWNDDQYIEYTKKAEESFSNQALRNEKIFIGEKVIIRQTADNFYAVFDNQKFYSMQSTYCITAKENESSDDLKYLACFLNSRIVKNYYSMTYKKDKTTFPQIRGYDVKDMPFVDATKAIKTRIAKLYDKLAQKSKKKPTMDILNDPIQEEVNMIIEELILKQSEKIKIAA
jgi:tRNA1(Val) A37 N6-methylase TrmN6